MKRLTQVALISLTLPWGAAWAQDRPPTAYGRVTDPAGQPLDRVFVTLRSPERGMSVSVMTDAGGEYRVSGLDAGRYQTTIHRLGYATVHEELQLSQDGISRDFVVSKLDEAEQMPAASFLALLPEGEVKRKFIIDCTGCHQFNYNTVTEAGAVKPPATWISRTDQMVSFAGASTPFPIISADRDSKQTAEWLTLHLGDRLPPLRDPFEDVPVSTDGIFTEYDLPVPQDLPHDLMLDVDGRIVITGMFTHQIYLLDPVTGDFQLEPIFQGANPRALDITTAGDWWVLLGNPRQMARKARGNTDWERFDIGMYPHSVMLDHEGRVWFNGHFSADPPLLGHLEPSSGAVEVYEVPTSGLADPKRTPIPYGLRVDREGIIWETELHGNRLIRFDPVAEEFKTYKLPTDHSAPRRLDIAPDGSVWIPEYAGNRLAKFDPNSESFTEFELPIPDALPYVVRVDGDRERIWIGTGGADALLMFDPVSERFTVYPLPTRTALLRHIDIDPESGTVWGAYGDSPAVHPRIVRLEPN